MMHSVQRATLIRGDTTLTLLAERAVWLAHERLLLVADLHLGKAVSFRKLGVPVPHGTTLGNLSRLTDLVHAHEALGIVFLGDFLHSVHAHAESTLRALAQWRAVHPQLRLTLVRGNHDDRAGDPPAWLGMRCVDEPLVIQGTSLRLCHYPQSIEGGFVLAGHAHPSVIVARGFERLRLACFHLTGSGLVMPAFGEFTGTHPVRRQGGDGVYAVADGQLLELP